jgi:hypothetical protein
MFLLYDGPADRMSRTCRRPPASVVGGSWFVREKWPEGSSVIFRLLWPIIQYDRCLWSAVCCAVGNGLRIENHPEGGHLLADRIRDQVVELTKIAPAILPGAKLR